MDARVEPLPASVYRYSGAQLLAAGAAAAVVVVLFANTFSYLYGVWHREEYSHGFMIPLVSAFLVWQRRERLRQTEFRGSWWGVVVVACGLALYFLGTVAAITTVDTYALVIVLMGAALALLGWDAFRIVLVPLALLLLMNPIPNFFYNNLSSQLQLISSQLGVAFIRACGVSVFLEGNVIDLGTYRLQVAEACSGLRYLFPLMTLGVIVGYLFRGRAWMRWTLFLSTIPITVVMNSVRIGIIGVLVDRFGIEQAEGFLHQFEGWVIFVACLLVLWIESWLLMRLDGRGGRLRDMFALEAAAPAARSPAARPRQLGKPALAVLALLVLAIIPSRALPARVELRPARDDLVAFPMRVGEWRGRRQLLDSIYLDTLKLDDYLLADYVPDAASAADAVPVNFYVAYYASQRTGQSAHSPRSCLPGGGWRILDFGPYRLPGDGPAAGLKVNRAVVQQGDSRELVYYWFQERGRDITNEYLVKWYLLRDAIVRNRTDGALVRLVTPIAVNEKPELADARLASFAGTFLPRLPTYVPN
ncbi:MAG TPA: VPLPA-CTERM-specific exosortase XrtD [Steroidobacteraceae bacterium]|nr:VPLPA-CTERM-specific exosortase XrtD [Steroidobacteraceae bacterium]